MANLILIRGLSGVGKTTLARALHDGMNRSVAVAADDYFEYLGVRFNHRAIRQAHITCQNEAREHLANGLNVIVHNTFSQVWEMQPYLDMAKEFGAEITVIDLFDNGFSDEELSKRNVHNVPIETIRKMRARWEHEWRRN